MEMWIFYRGIVRLSHMDGMGWNGIGFLLFYLSLSLSFLYLSFGGIQVTN